MRKQLWGWVAFFVGVFTVSASILGAAAKGGAVLQGLRGDLTGIRSDFNGFVSEQWKPFQIEVKKEFERSRQDHDSQLRIEGRVQSIEGSLDSLKGDVLRLRGNGASTEGIQNRGISSGTTPFK